MCKMKNSLVNFAVKNLIVKPFSLLYEALRYRLVALAIEKPYLFKRFLYRLDKRTTRRTTGENTHQD